MQRFCPSVRAHWAFVALFVFGLLASPAHASEADMVIPKLGDVQFLGGIGGDKLLMGGLLIGVLGLVFGMVGFTQLKKMPVHKSMLEVSELIYETCKTYVITQGKFLLILWLLVAPVIAIYFGWFSGGSESHAGDVATTQAVHASVGTAAKVAIILAMSLVGMAGSCGVAYFGIRVNTFANSRAAHASMAGKAYPIYAIPLRAGISIGMVLISVELLVLLAILLFIPGDLAGPCFIGFAIGESLGAAVLRIAGGIFTKIADIGADLMKIVFHIKEDDARNPGVIADCVGDNAGDSVGPTADGFETYGVTTVALISFILLGIKGHNTDIQARLLVWIFSIASVMVLTSGIAYLVNEAIAKARYGASKHFDFEKPLTNLVLIASGISLVATFVVSYLLLGDLNGNTNLWWKLASIVGCGTVAAAAIPEVIKVFTSTHSQHVSEIVTASREGGAGLNVLSGLSAGNFSAFWVGGVVIMGLMAIAYYAAGIGGETGLASIMLAPGVFAFGLVAFGFLSVGPVTIAVDSYGPVTDNAQSVYELSLIETQPGIVEDMQKNFGMTPDFDHAKDLLEENDGAGNTFKATAKPVLIGTAVVGATTMIFSIIMVLTKGLSDQSAILKLSLLHAPFFLGMIGGGAVIYWFSGASCQAVTTGAYRAVEYIKNHLHLEPGSTKASASDSKKVVAICTKYAQKGMLNIFLATFFVTLAAAFVEEYFFIGFLIGLAITGLFQAIFMANAGGAWDNAKKVVETELREKGTPLHDACVVGDIVGDPFKDTSSVALNPIIKFSTLFGLLAVELAITLKNTDGTPSIWRPVMAAVFVLIAFFFVHRSFYGMRIGKTNAA
jgi:K(+)-stimulated pyrophosphate-energized sodium pump